MNDHTDLPAIAKRGRGRPPKASSGSKLASGSSLKMFLPNAAVTKISEAARRQGGGRPDLLRQALFRGLIASKIITRADCEFLP